jgi:hypothetical protein
VAIITSLPEIDMEPFRRPARTRILLAFAIAAALIAARGNAQPVRNEDVTPIQIFPKDNPWNVDISAAPLDPNSASFITFIGANDSLHPDFGGEGEVEPEIYGMPYIVVSSTQPREPVTFVEYGNQSDSTFPGQPPGYPIPVEARTQSKWYEGGYPGFSSAAGDRHMLIIDRDQRLLYELYHTLWNSTLNRWEAGSGIIQSLDSNRRRPEGWTSADASGMAIFPGLVRYDEVFGANPIKHAFRFTVRATNGYVFPASHTAGNTGGAPPMGTRLRLKASKDISGFPASIQKIFQAMKTYGLIVADNGSDMYIQGTYDTRWDNGVLNPAFGALKASDFEVIELGWQPAVATTAGPLSFHTVTPCRLLDTRLAPSGAGAPPLHPSSEHRIVQASGRCGIPSTARSIAVNVTIVGPSARGHLTLFPGNASAPLASTINFRPGQVRANNAVVMLASSGSGTFGILNGSSAAVHTVVDVNGYFE